MPPAVGKQPRAAHEDPNLHSSVTVGTVTTRLTVTVPQGINGGDLVRVAAPDGSYHSIMVPGGLTSGQQFSVELLAAGTQQGSEIQRLRVRAQPHPFFFPTPGFHAAHGLLLAMPLTLRSLPPIRQKELDAERALRRETQQEALRSRSALEALQIKRAADHAYFRDVIKRQRRCIELLHDS